MTKKINRQRFTLIEMLVVVGIASLLFALVGPAFQRMIQGNAVERHASGLKLGMERARALAISSRRYVAMLLPSKISDTTNPLYNYQRGGFKYAYVALNSSNTYTFDGIIEGEDWTNRGNNKDAYLTLVSDVANTDISSKKPAEKYHEEDADLSKYFCEVESVPDNKGSKLSCRGLVFSPYGNIMLLYNLINDPPVELFFYITSSDVDNCLKLRLNTLTGKAEFIE